MDLNVIIQQALEQALKAQLDTKLDEVNKAIGEKINTQLASVEQRLDEKLAALSGTSVTVNYPTESVTLEEVHHSHLPMLQFLVGRKIPTLLIGPTGSGKTKAFFQLAKLLKVKPSRLLIKTVNKQTATHDFLGFVDATGAYRQRQFVELIQGDEPSLICIDELDNGNDNVLMLLKAVFTGYVELPSGNTVEVGKNVYIVGAMNTYGLGATREYVGRGPQDAALLNEFHKMEWPYDPTMEERLAKQEWNSWRHRDMPSQGYIPILKKLHVLREKVVGIRVIISTRNLLRVIRLVACGSPLWASLVGECLLHLTIDEQNRVKNMIPPDDVNLTPVRHGKTVNVNDPDCPI